jgi:hypothetical protein
VAFISFDKMKIYYNNRFVLLKAFIKILFFLIQYFKEPENQIENFALLPEPQGMVWSITT